MLKSILTAAAALAIAAGAAQASGDPAKGERVFKKCAACHQVGDGAKNRVGPILNGVVGREIASVDGFKYSKVFMTKKEEGLVWTPETLDAYLENPRKYIPKARMSFAGLRKDEDRADVIAYLESFGE